MSTFSVVFCKNVCFAIGMWSTSWVIMTWLFLNFWGSLSLSFYCLVCMRRPGSLSQHIACNLCFLIVSFCPVSLCLIRGLMKCRLEFLGSVFCRCWCALPAGRVCMFVSLFAMLVLLTKLALVRRSNLLYEKWPVSFSSEGFNSRG